MTLSCIRWFLAAMLLALLFGCGSAATDQNPPAVELTTVNGLDPMTELVKTFTTGPISFAGVMDAGATISVAVNSSATITNLTYSGTTWSAVLINPAQGANLISVVANDQGGNLRTLYFTILFDSLPPALSIDRYVTPSAALNQTLGGLVEAGVTPTVSSDTTATCTPITTNNSTWSCPVVGLVAGANTFTATATDAAGNMATISQILTQDNTAPLLTIDDTVPTRVNSTTLSGTLETSTLHTVVVTAPTGVIVGGIDYLTTPGAWQCPISLLPRGNNLFSVSLRDGLDVEVASAGAIVSYDLTPPQVTASDPVAATSVPSPVTFVNATFSEALDAANDPVLGLQDALGVDVPGSSLYDPVTRVVTFTPTVVPLATGTYRSTISGTIVDLAGNVFLGSSWTFTVTP